ncbi:ribonuclease H-like domain-containing protein [Tanacetum coccineum]|uniref:Ribonuclease H-like domain-containing protein n=1 Tax=Tanacetum coccineum TaxID=301880 RepID=A0ABQ5BL60_9ASTR
MNCHVTTTSPLPSSHVHALRDPNWKEAMLDEYNALITNETLVLVPRPSNVHVVRSMWLFRWLFKKPIHQLDVKNAFLHGQLSKTIYMHQPPGFVDSAHPDYVCHLQRSLYRLKQAPRAWGSDVAYLLLYVDDIVLIASSTALLQRIITLLHKEVLERAHMQHCNPCKTPVDTESNLGSDGDPVSDPTLYRGLAGALQYLTFTRPDISYAVQQICLHMHDPRDLHFTALKRILRYGTLSRSSAEAEYQGVANVVAETVWLRNLLLELHAPLSTATLVYCDNVSAVYLSTNHVQHQRTKHIEIDIHFVREYVASGQVRVLLVPSRFQYANIFTKGLPSALFLEFRSRLNV